jgi:hypothetical protein
MPLIKRQPQATVEAVAQAVASKPETTVLPASVEADVKVAESPTKGPATPEPKRLGGTRATGTKAEGSMTKDDYWKRREERDIQNSQHMRRAGAFQACLQSVGLLQLNTGNTLEDYLKLVEQAADRCVQYVEKQ